MSLIDASAVVPVAVEDVKVDNLALLPVQVRVVHDQGVLDDMNYGVVLNRIRADVIRQFCERPGGEEMAELLMFLEGKGWARQAMIEELRSKIAGD